MTRKEFEEYFASRGINLSHYGVFAGVKSNMPECMGCYYEDGVWKLYQVGERQDFGVLRTGTEEEIFDFLFYEAKRHIDWVGRNK